MDPLDDNAAIRNEELVYRRIPVSQNWYVPEAQFLNPNAFKPRTDDATGLSLVRGNPYNTPESAAQGPSQKGYYLAVLRVGDLRSRGLQVVPRPVDGIRGHAEIANLNASNRASDEAHTLMVTLAHELCLRVEGPFGATKL